MNLSTEQIEQRAEKSLTYLASTDQQAADLKFEASKAEHLYKNAVDAHFLALEGSIEIRKAQARINAEPAYIAFLEAQRAYDVIRNNRDRESLVLEWLRSLNANRRQGT
jgi:hypothetical protein